jgi:hypothetical protein
MKIIILIKYLIYEIITNLLKSSKVFFASALEYLNFRQKFNADLKFINDLWKINFKFKSNDSYIITDTYDDSSLYCYNLLTHAKKIQKIKKLPIIAFDKNFSFVKNFFYKSFEINHVVYLNSFFFSVFIIVKQFKIIFKEFIKIYKINSTSDLSYNYKDIEISNIAYDNYLRFNLSGTVDNLKKFKFYIFKTLLISIKIEYFFDNKKIDSFAAKENQFSPRANLFQYILKRKCISYHFVGTSNYSSMRKYKRFSQRSIPRTYINKRFYLYAFSKRSNYIQKAKIILDKKFLSEFTENELLDAKYVFSKKHYNLSKDELCKKLKLDNQKKLIIVFSHNVYDGVFEIRRKLFIDNFIWLKETLNILSQNPHINVLVKKHPTEFSKRSIKDISLRAIEEIPDLKYNNIKLYPEFLSPQFIKKNAHCIVTGHGTAGIEYACYGIPSISCNNSPYSYCKTSYEAKNYQEYDNYLKNIDKLAPLNDAQIEKSLVLFFLTHSLDKNKNDFFETLPDFHPSELVGFQKNFEYRCLEKIFKKLRNIKKIEETDIYQKYLKFLTNNNYSMYDTNKLK